MDDYSSGGAHDFGIGYVSYRPDVPMLRKQKTSAPGASQFKRQKRVEVFEAPADSRWVSKAISRNIGVEFQKLAASLFERQQYSSLLADLHHSEEYLKVISLGPKVVPHMLRDLQMNGNPWYLALRVLTGERVGQDLPEGNLRELAAAWIQWGTKQGML
ncbi:hypothetical protein LRH25_01495 [Ideonella azotifigens]|uniref:Uncharacterized protein n=1 Tax=Ideonella azotifigens TaxID=513160 RepID=A0ABN1K9P5_9BURK|nr:hypothetical protein [Ideonella azotifigens]MCD2339008.1 hypothetical protein [Ideonella azotifigens]